MARQARVGFALVLAAVVALLAAVPGSARLADDLYTLTPTSPTLAKATVGVQYGSSFRVTYDGKPAEGALIGCDLSKASDPAVQFNDCAKLPPGLGLKNVQGCSNNDNGCLILDGVPTKAGTYKFRIAALGGANGGYIVREYTLVVQLAKYDLVLDWDNDNKQPGETRISFLVVNRGDATSAATTVDFDTVVKNTDKKVTFSALWFRGTDTKPTACKELVCTVPALVAHGLGQHVIYNITAKLHVKNVREGGTYVQIRGDIPCNEKDEKSCANNHSPVPHTWHKVAVGS